MSSPKTTTVFAPATVANVNVGFDLLGYALPRLGDWVVLRDSETPGLHLREIRFHGVPPTSIPSDPSKNTALVAAHALLNGNHPALQVTLIKGIPLASGLGGSAASAAAMVIALNHHLGLGARKEQLFQAALAGEAAASGAVHGDNVAPSLWGGIQLLTPSGPKELPAPPDLFSLVVYPNQAVETAQARALLPKTIPLAAATAQNSRLAAFVHALHVRNYSMLEGLMIDPIVTPHRTKGSAFFELVTEICRSQLPLAHGLSGSGPSVFIWTKTQKEAKDLSERIEKESQAKGITAQSWITPLKCGGATVVPSAGETP